MNNNNQNQTINYLNQFLSSLAVFNIKMYNFHWNMTGPEFFELHLKFQEYYEKVTEEFDLVAERIKQLGGYPVTSLEAYSQMSIIREFESKNYNAKESITNTITDMRILHKFGNDIKAYAASLGDDTTSGIIGDFLKYLEKQMWMLEATMK